MCLGGTKSAGVALRARSDLLEDEVDEEDEESAESCDGEDKRLVLRYRGGYQHSKDPWLFSSTFRIGRKMPLSELSKPAPF